jgi:hypothetical protein
MATTTSAAVVKERPRSDAAGCASAGGGTTEGMVVDGIVAEGASIGDAENMPDDPSEDDGPASQGLAELMAGLSVEA